MLYKDLNDLELLLNTVVKIKATYPLEGNSFFTEVFYAFLKEISGDFIIVEHQYVKVDEHYKDTITIQKRKHKNGYFEVLPEEDRPY